MKIQGNYNTVGGTVSALNRWTGVRAGRTSRCFVFPEWDSTGDGPLSKAKEQPRYQSAMVEKVMRVGANTSIESAAGAIAMGLSNYEKASLASSLPARDAAWDCMGCECNVND